MSAALDVGIHDILPAQYHADPCLHPSLSSGTIRRLLQQSPMHAHYHHPRLGGGEDEPPSRAMTDGSALHVMLLGKGAEIVSIDATDFRTKAAQEARDDALASGCIPLLRTRAIELEQIAEAALMQMRDHPGCDGLFDPGLSEAVLVWRERGVWCRAMVDRLPERRPIMFDLKTTGLSANPLEWHQQIVRTYAIQAAFYRRGLMALGKAEPEFRFVVVETKPPYGVSVQACAPELLQYADRQIDRAITLWGDCLYRNEWPGYPPHVAYAELPSWTAAQELERQYHQQDIMELS